jgi:hypothetical protein
MAAPRSRVERVKAPTLRSARERLGTREAVARSLQVAESTIHRYESEGGPFWYWYALRGLASTMGK